MKKAGSIAPAHPELFPAGTGLGLSPRHTAALRSWREAEGMPAIVHKFEAAADFLVKEQGRWSAPAAAAFVRLVHGHPIRHDHRTALGRIVCQRRPDLAQSCARVPGVFDTVAAFEADRKKRRGRA